MSKSETLTFYPFSYALLDDELESYCWYCLSERNVGNNPLRKCSGCKIALFCDKNCQTLGWQDHKAECKGFSKLDGPVPDVEVRMLGRIVSRYKMIITNKDSRQDNFYVNRRSRRVIMQICDHAEDMRADQSAWKKFQSILERLTKFYDKNFLFDQEVIFQLHCRNYINRHGISDRSYLKEIAKGLYLDLCAYDHSCRPNTIYTCDGFVATLRPLNDTTNISKIESTFYTYTDLLLCKQQRRKMLQESWYFYCKCDRCVDESEHILTSIVCDKCTNAICIFEKDDTLKKNVKCDCGNSVEESNVLKGISGMRFIDNLLNKNEFDEFNRKEAIRFISDLIEQYKFILHRTNVYYVRLLQALILRSDPNDTETLLKYHLEATDCMRVCYPVNHPALAYHLLNIGIFYCKLNKYNEALPFLSEAKTMLVYVLGVEHSMTKQVLDWLEVCASSVYVNDTA